MAMSMCCAIGMSHRVGIKRYVVREASVSARLQCSAAQHSTAQHSTAQHSALCKLKSQPVMVVVVHCRDVPPVSTPS